MNRFVRTLCLSLAVTGGIYVGACGGDDTTAQENNGLSDVIYQGNTNDEALEQLLAAPSKNDESQAAVVDMPLAGIEVPSSPPAVFTWHSGATAFRTPARQKLLDVPALASPRVPALVELASLFGPVREAEAHGPPVNGKVYFMTLATVSNPTMVRVFTDQTSYTPTQDVWDKLSAKHEVITITILTAYFDNDVLAADGGPFTGVASTFTIAP